MAGLFRSVGFSESTPLQLEETSNSRWGGFVYTVTKHLLFHQQVAPHRSLFIPNMSKKKIKNQQQFECRWRFADVVCVVRRCGGLGGGRWCHCLLLSVPCGVPEFHLTATGPRGEEQKLIIKDGRTTQTASSQTVEEWRALVVHIKMMFNWTF